MCIIGIPLKYSHLNDGRPILYLGERIRRTIQKAGGFIIPIVQVQDVFYSDTRYNEFNELSEEDKKNIDRYLNMVDGVIFPGGFKITPFDKYLLEECIRRDIPTLGICLGMQLMSCYKDDFKVYPNETDINHFQESDDLLSHEVIIKKDSLLYDIIKKESIMVNSFHRFHVSSNDYFDVCCESSDGYIEGMWMKDKKFVLGIQWHPEISYDFDDNSKKLIDYFISICK